MQLIVESKATLEGILILLIKDISGCCFPFGYRKKKYVITLTKCFNHSLVINTVIYINNYNLLYTILLLLILNSLTKHRMF